MMITSKLMWAVATVCFCVCCAAAASAADANRPAAGPLENAYLKVTVSDRGEWTLETKDGATARIASAAPAAQLGGQAWNPADSVVTVAGGRETNTLGAFDARVVTYRRKDGLTLTHSLWLSMERPEMIVRLDVENGTDQSVQLDSVSALATSAFDPGGVLADWRMVKTAHAMESRHDVGGLVRADMDSHVAMRNRKSGTAFVAGFLSHRRGVGRLHVGDPKEGSVPVRATVHHGIPLPRSMSVVGEPLLIAFGATGLECLERFGDLVAREHGIELRKTHPLDDATTWAHTELSSFGSYVLLSELGRNTENGGIKADFAEVRRLGLDRFGYAHEDRYGSSETRGGCKFLGRNQGADDPWSEFNQEDFARMRLEHPRWFVERGMDFSHPEVIAFQRELAEKGAEGKASLTYGADFIDTWRYSPRQYDKTCTVPMLLRNTIVAIRAAAPKAWGLCWLNDPVLGYGLWDRVRIGMDSDRGYDPESSCRKETRHLTFLPVCVPSQAHRYFYNGRVFWNDPDSYHVYALGRYSLGEARVHASFCAFAANVTKLGEPLAFMADNRQALPADRMEIVKKVSPAGADTARPLDFFESTHPAVWHMPIARPFGKWDLVAVFAYFKGKSREFHVEFRELGLDAGCEYLVYEFWSDRFVGAMRQGFQAAFQGADCGVYSVVEKKGHPQLISTSRHIRHMANDIVSLAWKAESKTLTGTSKIVKNEPYELRIHVPAGFVAKSVRVSGGLTAVRKADGPILRVGFTPSAWEDVRWEVGF
jgi:hypothetical protein